MLFCEENICTFLIDLSFGVLKRKQKKKKRSACGHLGPEGDTGSFLLPALVLGPSVCREMSPAHSLPVLIPFQELILCVCHISFGLPKHRLLDERGILHRCYWWLGDARSCIQVVSFKLLLSHILQQQRTHLFQKM